MLEALVDGYLSEVHLRDTETGCTLSLLGSETRRQSPKIRRLATRHIKELVAALARETPDALATLATLVGGAVIARIVDDAQLRKEVRASVRAAALKKER
jgi:hypothetical protein